MSASWSSAASSAADSSSASPAGPGCCRHTARAPEHSRGRTCRRSVCSRVCWAHAGSRASRRSLLLADYVLRKLDGQDDRAWIVARHGRLYADEADWDAGFEALVSEVVDDLAHRGDSPLDAAWIAEVDGRRAGSVA